MVSCSSSSDEAAAYCRVAPSIRTCHSGEMVGYPAESTPASTREPSDRGRGRLASINPGIAAALERLEAIDPDIGAFVHESNRRSRLETIAPADGPLHGLPVGVKDLYRVDGLPTRGGSRLPSSIFEGEESVVVTKLKEAGAVVLGKTAMDEFAYCEPPPTKNPRDTRRTPGGSSGGSAAAVAAGICRLAVGSQTLQSIVVPAAFCGVVGFKLTFGRLEFDGLPLAPSIDSVGFLAASVADLRAAVSALIPGWREPIAPSRPVMGVLEPWGPRAPRAEGWRAYETHLELLRSHGFELRPTRVPWDTPEDLGNWGTRVGDLLHAEMALVHGLWFDRFAHLYRPRTAEAVRMGQAISAKRLRECRVAGSNLANMLQEGASQTGIDCWVCPSASGVAPIGYGDTGDASMTSLWSYAGFPALSLPVFDVRYAMPLGIQLVAPPGRDEALLGWGTYVEGVLAETLPPADAGTRDCNTGRTPGP
jgi:Asp-tRNA(Asn)/Glu-tRNA(Gln) amidotransferase A subunit family amidase